MEWLRITIVGIVAIILLLITFLQVVRFRKELKEELTKSRSLSRRFVGKWGKYSSKIIILIVLATILYIVLIFIRR